VLRSTWDPHTPSLVTRALASQSEFGGTGASKVSPGLGVTSGGLRVDRVISNSDVLSSMHAESRSINHTLLDVVEGSHTSGSARMPSGEDGSADDLVEGIGVVDHLRGGEQRLPSRVLGLHVLDDGELSLQGPSVVGHIDGGSVEEGVTSETEVGSGGPGGVLVSDVHVSAALGLGLVDAQGDSGLGTGHSGHRVEVVQLVDLVEVLSEQGSNDPVELNIGGSRSKGRISVV